MPPSPEYFEGWKFIWDRMPPQCIYPKLTHCMSRFPGKFACRIMMQGTGFALPITITVPVVIPLLILFCGLREDDPCYFSDTIPDYLFFTLPTFPDLITEKVRNHCLLKKIYMQTPKINCVRKPELDAQLILITCRPPLRVPGVSKPIIRRYNLCIK